MNIDWSKPMAEIKKDIRHSMTTGMTVKGTSTGQLTKPNPEPHELLPMTQEEMDRGPMPEWAIGTANGELVLGAQLPTKDGRICGNGHIVNITPVDAYGGENVHHILTDAGSTMELTAREVRELFHKPTWVSDVQEVKRKFKPTGTPLHGLLDKNPDYCRCEIGTENSPDCGCAFGQCAKGLVY